MGQLETSVDLAVMWVCIYHSELQLRRDTGLLEVAELSCRGAGS